MADNIEPITKKLIRERPFMYLGRDGIIGLFAGILIDCIKMCKTDQIIFEIIIIGDNEFSIVFSSHDNESLILPFTSGNEGHHLFILKMICEMFEIAGNNVDKAEVKFSFDKTVVPDTSIDYFGLSEKMLLLSLLNRRTEIIIIDKTKKYLCQNYYHFPQGIFYLFDRIRKEALGQPEFEVVFDGEIGSNKYQIGISYRRDWYPTPNIISFANDVQTICGGSMVEGILDGLISSCKRYVKENKLTAVKIKRKKFLNGLIIVCLVRNGDFSYGGSFKEVLDDDLVKKQVKKLIDKLIFDFLSQHKEKAYNFLWRFDTKQIANGMY